MRGLGVGMIVAAVLAIVIILIALWIFGLIKLEMFSISQNLSSIG